MMKADIKQTQNDNQKHEHGKENGGKHRIPKICFIHFSQKHGVYFEKGGPKSTKGDIRNAIANHVNWRLIGGIHTLVGAIFRSLICGDKHL